MERFDFVEFLGRFMDAEAPLFKVLKELPAVGPDGPWIAGGAIRRTLLNEPLASDFDFFFRDAEQSAAFMDDMIDKGAWKISSNEHAVTYGISIDKKSIVVQAIIIGHYATLDAVLDSFDFTITQFGYDGKDLVCGRYALWDLARRRLALHKLTFGVSTVRRLIKYTKQGFTACSGVLASILEATVADPATIHRDTEYVD